MRDGIWHEALIKHSLQKCLMEADILLQSNQQAYREKNKSTTMLLIENFGLILQFGVHWQQFFSTTWLLAPLTPDLAMGCQRLLDFQSTAKDFEGSQIEMGRSNVWWRFTHGWVRDRDKNKRGFCGRFEAESWHYSVLSHDFNSIFMQTVPLSVILLPRPFSLGRMKDKSGGTEDQEMFKYIALDDKSSWVIRSI